MTDTDAKADEVRIALLRAMSPARRLALATGWSTTLRELTRASLREQFAGESETKLRRRFAERWLGEELATKAYGPAVADG